MIRYLKIIFLMICQLMYFNKQIPYKVVKKLNVI